MKILFSEQLFLQSCTEIYITILAIQVAYTSNLFMEIEFYSPQEIPSIKCNKKDP